MAKRELTEAAKTAKAIRTELKGLFPATKFRVTSDNFSGGDAVRISWTDGPTDDEVSAIVRKHEYGTFDGMTDCYNYDNRRDDIPQVKYLTVKREMGVDTTAALVAWANEYWGREMTVTDEGRIENDPWTPGGRMGRDIIWRRFVKLSLVCPSCKAAREVADVYCGDCGAKLGGEE